MNRSVCFDVFTMGSLLVYSLTYELFCLKILFQHSSILLGPSSMDHPLWLTLFGPSFFGPTSMVHPLWSIFICLQQFILFGPSSQVYLLWSILFGPCGGRDYLGEDLCYLWSLSKQNQLESNPNAWSTSGFELEPSCQVANFFFYFFFLKMIMVIIFYSW